MSEEIELMSIPETPKSIMKLQDEYKKTVIESCGMILGFEFSVEEETDDDGRKIRARMG